MGGKRKLSILEWAGLVGQPWTFHLHYSKLDNWDMYSILQKKYDPEDKKPEAHICMRRQEAVSRHVIANNYLSRLIALPFIFYGGTFVGRVVGDILTGRNAEYGRERFLGRLPAKVYFEASRE